MHDLIEPTSFDFSIPIVLEHPISPSLELGWYFLPSSFVHESPLRFSSSKGDPQQILSVSKPQSTFPSKITHSNSRNDTNHPKVSMVDFDRG